MFEDRAYLLDIMEIEYKSIKHEEDTSIQLSTET